MVKWFINFTFLSSLIALSGICAEAIPSNSNASQNKPIDAQAMFNINSARNIFSKDALLPEVAGLQFKDEDFTSSKNPNNKNIIYSDNQKLQSPSSAIIAEFGDPSIPHPVKAVDTAPKPYKAMIEALRTGDRQLAYQYAGQYVKYLEDLQRINSELVAIQGKAMEETGALPKGESWASLPQFDEYNDLTLEVNKQVKDKNSQDQITSELKKLINQAKSENDLFYNEEKEKELDEKKEKALARMELSDGLPYTKSGNIDVYFFFKFNEQPSIDLGKEIEKLTKKFTGDSKINILGFAINGHNEEAAKVYRKKTGAEFKIVGGIRLAELLNIKTTPQIVFMNTENSQHIKINKKVSDVYLEEAIKIMRGE